MTGTIFLLFPFVTEIIGLRITGSLLPRECEAVCCCCFSADLWRIEMPGDELTDKLSPVDLRELVVDAGARIG